MPVGRVWTVSAWKHNNHIWKGHSYPLPKNSWGVSAFTLNKYLSQEEGQAHRPRHLELIVLVKWFFLNSTGCYNSLAMISTRQNVSSSNFIGPDEVLIFILYVIVYIYLTTIFWTLKRAKNWERSDRYLWENMHDFRNFGSHITNEILQTNQVNKKLTSSFIKSALRKSLMLLTHLFRRECLLHIHLDSVLSSNGQGLLEAPPCLSPPASIQYAYFIWQLESKYLLCLLHREWNRWLGSKKKLLSRHARWFYVMVEDTKTLMHQIKPNLWLSAQNSNTYRKCQGVSENRGCGECQDRLLRIRGYSSLKT